MNPRFVIVLRPYKITYLILIPARPQFLQAASMNFIAIARAQ